MVEDSGWNQPLPAPVFCGSRAKTRSPLGVEAEFFRCGKGRLGVRSTALARNRPVLTAKRGCAVWSNRGKCWNGGQQNNLPFLGGPLTFVQKEETPYRGNKHLAAGSGILIRSVVDFARGLESWERRASSGFKPLVRKSRRQTRFGAFCLDVRTLTFCQRMGFPKLLEGEQKATEKPL